eukprot:11915111-Alexandrium_andersonii.AAC.1
MQFQQSHSALAQSPRNDTVGTWRGRTKPRVLAERVPAPRCARRLSWRAPAHRPQPPRRGHPARQSQWP